MKIRPFFILFSFLLLIAQNLIFSDAVMVIRDSYPVMVFIVPIIIAALPIEIDKSLLLIISFLVGLILDVFNDTLGINTFALVMMAYFRSFITNLIQPRIGYKSAASGFRKYGYSWMTVYLFLCLLVFIFSYFMIDAFTFVYLKKVLVSTLVSTLVSIPFGVIILSVVKSN